MSPLCLHKNVYGGKSESKQMSILFVLSQILKSLAATEGSNKLSWFIEAHICLLRVEEVGQHEAVWALQLPWGMGLSGLRGLVLYTPGIPRQE